MKQLPALLEPWRPWLSLFPPDLAEPLGGFLLRLHPQIGPLRSAPARADALPEGVGSIVQRGPYERLLISEWAYADAEPDEFIRRAAGGELMFTGPEPAARRRSRRCVVLFDTGPAQLGEPRMLHLALFILLARRAEEAGALFEWGTVQHPGKLQRDSDRSAIQALLKERTLAAATPANVADWAEELDSDSDDTWLIGARGLQAGAGMRGQIAIRRNLLAEQLDVVVTVHQATRQLALALPAPELAIRLLRSPFAPLASRAVVRAANSRPSLTQAPRFAVASRMLAVPQQDGGVIVYPVPKSLRAQPGESRHHAAQRKGDIFGAGVYGKGMGALVRDGGLLRFKGFPCEGFSSRYACIAFPPDQQFLIPSQGASWLPVFFLKRDLAKTQGGARVIHNQVLALDTEGRLASWYRTSSQQAGTMTNTDIEFAIIANDVIGAEQTEHRLLYATADDAGTHVYSYTAGGMRLSTLPYKGTRLLFGDLMQWPRMHGHGLLALRCNDTDWWVGSSEEMTMVKIADGALVAGVAMRRDGSTGLIVLAPRNRIIELRSGTGVSVLVRASEDIAQVSVCPRTGNIAWIGARSHRLCVQSIEESRPYLEVVGNGGSDAA